jgi:hypothetical protein
VRTDNKTNGSILDARTIRPTHTHTQMACTRCDGSWGIAPTLADSGVLDETGLLVCLGTLVGH